MQFIFLILISIFNILYCYATKESDSLYYETESIHMAVYSGEIERVEQLAKKTDLLNQRNQAGNTPLHIAIMMNDQEVTSHLLFCSANPKIPNEDGITAEDLAKTKNIKLIAKRREKKVKFTKVNSEGHSVFGVVKVAAYLVFLVYFFKQ